MDEGESIVCLFAWVTKDWTHIPVYSLIQLSFMMSPLLVGNWTSPFLRQHVGQMRLHHQLSWVFASSTLVWKLSVLWELEWRTASVPEGSQSPQASALWQELFLSVITVDNIFLFLQWPFSFIYLFCKHWLIMLFCARQQKDRAMAMNTCRVLVPQKPTAY